MTRIDMKQTPKWLYRQSADAPSIVEAPELSFLMVDGAGDPNTAPAYAEAVEALYIVAYTLKFMLKNGPEALDYAVMPLQGLWWADDLSRFGRADREACVQMNTAALAERSAKVASRPSASFCCSSAMSIRRSTLPSAVLGSSARNSTSFGSL
jgi:hypothetical protein